MRFQQGLGGVADNIEQYLNHLIPVGNHIRQADIVIPPDRDPLGVLRQQQLTNMLQAFMHIHRLELRRLARTKHTICHRAQPVCLIDDDFGVLGQLRVRQSALQQLSRPADTPQRVLDLVGHPSHQRPGRLMRMDQRFFPGDAQQPIQRLHFHQQAQGLPGFINRTDGIIHSNFITRRHRKTSLPPREGMLILDALAQGITGFFVIKKIIRQRLPHGTAGAGGKQHLCRRIQIADLQLVIQHDHRSAQVIQ